MAVTDSDRGAARPPDGRAAARRRRARSVAGTVLSLVLTMLGETSTRDISRAVKPETFAENQEVARRGGAVAGIARQALEAETGRPVISAQKAAELNRLAVDLIEGAARMADGKEAKEEKGEGAPDPADLPPRP